MSNAETKPVNLTRDEMRERYPSMGVREASMANLKARIVAERQAERDATRAEAFEEAAQKVEDRVAMIRSGEYGPFARDAILQALPDAIRAIGRSHPAARS